MTRRSCWLVAGGDRQLEHLPYPGGELHRGRVADRRGDRAALVRVHRGADAVPEPRSDHLRRRRQRHERSARADGRLLPRIGVRIEDQPDASLMAVWQDYALYQLTSTPRVPADTGAEDATPSRLLAALTACYAEWAEPGAPAAGLVVGWLRTPDTPQIRFL